MFVRSNCMFCKCSVNIHIWHFLSNMHTHMHARSHTGWWEVKTFGFFGGWHSVLVSLLLCLIPLAFPMVVRHPQLEQKDTAVRGNPQEETQGWGVGQGYGVTVRLSRSSCMIKVLSLWESLLSESSMAMASSKAWRTQTTLTAFKVTRSTTNKKLWHKQNSHSALLG